jgi:hypothetical protein
VVTLATLLCGYFISPTVSAEELVRRPAIVIRFQPETIGNVTFQWVNLRIQPKTRTRDAKPFEAKLDTASTKIAFVSTTGRRRPATRDDLKPEMRVWYRAGRAFPAFRLQPTFRSWTSSNESRDP